MKRFALKVLCSVAFAIFIFAGITQAFKIKLTDSKVQVSWADTDDAFAILMANEEAASF